MFAVIETVIETYSWLNTIHHTFRLAWEYSYGNEILPFSFEALQMSELSFVGGREFVKS